MQDFQVKAGIGRHPPTFPGQRGKLPQQQAVPRGIRDGMEQQDIAQRRLQRVAERRAAAGQTQPFQPGQTGPLGHPIALTRVTVEFELLEAEQAVVCRASAETVGPTGVEMEALTAVNCALLTIYDMCKAADRGMVLSDIRLLEKHGGKSGSFVSA